MPPDLPEAQPQLVMWTDGTVPAEWGFPVVDRPTLTNNVEIWKLRGAIATGMAVFSYWSSA